MASVNISDWYNNADYYPELTLVLRDDRKIQVHRSVICKANAYFEGLCGRGSLLVDSKVIELKDDVPEAVEYILRKSYGLTSNAIFVDNPCLWRFWYDLFVTAEKYLLPSLVTHALKCFKLTALKLNGSDAILDILDLLKKEAISHPDSGLDKFAVILKKQDLTNLLHNKRYRARLDGSKCLLWEHLDELVAAQHLVEKQYFLCDAHSEQLFTGIGEDVGERRTEPCQACAWQQPSSHSKMPKRTVYLLGHNAV